MNLFNNISMWMVFCTVNYIQFGNALRDVPILRVMGGSKARLEDFPHSVYLISGRVNCGGSVITSRAILTAGHCEISAEETIAMIGGSVPHSAPQIVSILDVKKHELFGKSNRKNYEYDIAIAFTNSAIVFSPSVKKAVLATNEYQPATRAFVAGWGQTTFGNIHDVPAKRKLRAVEQRVQDRSLCMTVFKDMTTNMLCAGEQKGSNRVRVGDSGSALVVDGYIQIGIVSYGRPNPEQTCMTVYTNVIPLRKWITKTVTEFRRKYCTSPRAARPNNKRIPVSPKSRTKPNAKPKANQTSRLQ